MSGRIIAVGDIHGCDTAFDRLLEMINLTPRDTLVVLGDVIDRGPGTRQVVDRLLELRGFCTLECIMGNHEEIFLNARVGGAWSESWLEFGGREMLDSYDGTIDSIPEEHIAFLEEMLPSYETETDLFVHAHVEPRVHLAQQKLRALRWDRYTGDEPPHYSKKRVICGHTAQRTGRPALHEGWLCLDTWVYGRGWLSALDTATNMLWQAKQSGEVREGEVLEG